MYNLSLYVGDPVSVSMSQSIINVTINLTCVILLFMNDRETLRSLK